MRHKRYHHRINLRIDSDLYNALLQLSQVKGMGITDLCRQILREGT